MELSAFLIYWVLSFLFLVVSLRPSKRAEVPPLAWAILVFLSPLFLPLGIFYGIYLGIKKAGRDN